MKVYTIFKNIVNWLKSNASRITSNESRLDALESDKNIYSGKWTANSSSANLTILTETITVPSGYYIIIVKYPSVSTYYYSYLAINNSSSSDNPDTVYYGNGYQTSVCFRKFTSSTSLVVRSGQGASCTFAQLERGGLFVMRIGNVGG